MKQVATVSELREKGRKVIEVNNKRILLFFSGGRVYAFDTICPHRFGSLEEGEVIEGEIVCPSHGYTYGLEDGQCSTSPGYKIHTYKVKLDGEKVLIDFS